MAMKRFDGKKWVDYVPKTFNGKSWVDSVVRRFNGKSWDIISEKTYQKTWGATWSQSYNGTGTNYNVTRKAIWGDTVSHYAMWYKRTWDDIVKWNNLKSPHVIRQGVTYIVDKVTMPKKRDTPWLYQGSRGDDHKIQRSMIGFDYMNMQKELKGAKIEKVEVYLKNQASWLSAGTQAYVGYHNSYNNPADFSQSHYGQKAHDIKIGEGKWFDLNNGFAELIRDNKIKGLTLYVNSAQEKYYGVFVGASGSGEKPQVRITYKK